MTFWDVLNSKLVLLILAFVLTTLAGGFLSSSLQRALWQRQTRVDLFRKRYEEGTKFLDDLSRLVGKRFYQLQRFVWAMKDSVGENLLGNIEAEYFQVVADWNSSLRMNRNKIRLLIGERQANDFLNYEDDNHPENPQSLHYRFVKAHEFAIRAKHTKDLAPAQKEVDHLKSSLLNLP